MRKLLLLLPLALPCVAAITNLQVAGATPREAILRYVAPTPAACTIEVSESPAYLPLVNDVNPGLFAGSNSDFRNGAQGRERTFIIGNGGVAAAYAPVDANGKRSSRALQTNTVHYFRITCGSDVSTGTFSTANIATGDTFPAVTAPIDPATPGIAAWPFLDWSDDNGVIDPITGVFVQKLAKINAQQSGANTSVNAFAHAYDASGNWVNPNNILADDGALATFTGATNDPVTIITDVNPNNGINTTVLTGLTLKVHGFVDSGSTTLEACLVVDGATCFGPYTPITGLPVGSLGATVEAGDPNIYSGAQTHPAATVLAAWLSPNQMPPSSTDTSVRSGFADNTGAVLTLQSASSSFDPKWTSATHISFGGVEYTVAAVASGTSITISGSPANGSFVSWAARNFGFKIRKSSAGGTISLDSVKVVFDQYVSPIVNGSSGGSKQCTTSRYHEGWRIGGPSNETTNAATNTSPIVMTTTTPHDFITGDVVTQINVPGNTAANGTFTINKLSASTYSLNGSTGNGTFPSDAGGAVTSRGGGLAWKSTSKTGHLCSVSNADSLTQLYWVHPDTTPAIIRFLGPAYTTGFGPNSANVGITDESDPNIPTQYNIVADTADPTKQQVIKGVYIGNQNTGMFRDSGQDLIAGGFPWAAIWYWASITPSPNTLTDRLAAFDSTFTGGANATRFQANGLLAFTNTLYQQNTLGWMGIYNVNTGVVTGLMNTWKNPNARYCGLHTALAWEGAGMYSWVPYELIGDDRASSAVPYDGPYRMVSNSGAMSATPSDCATQLAAIGAANPLAVTGNNCTTVTVISNIPTTPSNRIPANDTLNNLGVAIGDLFRIYQPGGVLGGGVFDNEDVKLVGYSGTTFVIQRGIDAYGVTAHASGYYLHEFCTVIPRWWDYTNAPHGSTGTDPYSQNLSGNIQEVSFSNESHYFTRDGFSVNDQGAPVLTPAFPCSSDTASATHVASYGTRSYPWPNHVTAPASAYGCVGGNPLFDGVYGNGQGNYLEKHPSPIQNFTANHSWLDGRPYATSTQWQQTTSKIGTYLYKTTGYNEFSSFDDKRNVAYVMIGHRTARDVSAPFFTLPDTIAYNYTYCLAHIAGECAAGSAAGDVYVNAPYVAAIPLGWANQGQYRCQPKLERWSDNELNDVCVAIQSPYADYMVQYSGDHDPYNTGARRITNGFVLPRRTDPNWNTPPLPNGDWAITINYWGNGGSRSMMNFAKIPPYPGPQRGVNRGSWIPIPVNLTSVPAGTNNVIVEFGYNPNLFCSTRQEICVANSASITAGLYYYAISDAYSGLACATGCTPMLPTLSQRVIWYRVKYRNASNAVIKTGEVQVAATP